LKQHVVRMALGLLVVLVFLGHAARFYQVGFISQLDQIIYDYRLRLTMPGTLDNRIVILDIDEKSLAVPELGRWPWGRDKMSTLVDKLFDKYGIAVLGFDVVWAERDESSGLKVLDQLARKELREFPQFAAALNSLRPQLDTMGCSPRLLAAGPLYLATTSTAMRTRVSRVRCPTPCCLQGHSPGATSRSRRGMGLGKLARAAGCSSLVRAFQPRHRFRRRGAAGAHAQRV